MSNNNIDSIEDVYLYPANEMQTDIGQDYWDKTKKVLQLLLLATGRLGNTPANNNIP